MSNVCQSSREILPAKWLQFDASVAALVARQLRVSRIRLGDLDQSKVHDVPS
jgi:hypothetical protein